MDVKRNFSIVNWGDVSESIKISNPEFHQLIEEVNPNNNLKLYIFKFGYGDYIGDSNTFYIPDQGELKTLNMFSADHPITKDLFYGFHSSPLGLVMNKCFEWYLTGENPHETHPVYIDKAGDFFNIGHITRFRQNKNYLPNGILSVKAGAQSSFLLQHLGCQRGFNRLKKAGVRCAQPKSHTEHSQLFHNIYNAFPNESSWQASILYFSKAWIENILNNSKWLNVNRYFTKYHLTSYAYGYYGDYYQHIFRKAFDKSNIERDFFIQDASKYIFEILIGEKYGFGFVNNEELIPFKLISTIMDDVYELKSSPSILVPMKHHNNVVYFSLNKPIFRTYQGLSRKKATLMSELEKLYVVTMKYKELFSSDDQDWRGTILADKSEFAEFGYYHGFEKKHDWMSDQDDLFRTDPTLHNMNDFYKDSPFFKGCMSVHSK